MPQAAPLGAQKSDFIFGQTSSTDGPALGIILKTPSSVGASVNVRKACSAKRVRGRKPTQWLQYNHHVVGN